MNSSSPVDSSAKSFDGFTLTFGISIGVLSVIAIAIVVYFLCTRKPMPSHHDGSSSDEDSVTIAIGLDEATLDNYPKLLYSEAKGKLEKGDDSIASCCSICLANYKDSDLLRLLPECHHLFHPQCIDPWLKLHANCPLCRTSPVRSLSNVNETASGPPRQVFYDTCEFDRIDKWTLTLVFDEVLESSRISILARVLATRSINLMRL
ncbi:unnamed protein product [Dovyalis caffra]|uniref:RING-type E3 ubiquitin transferase n=1 Tax=Dovyalis caffra TaxID=77055 RepID=A0AAV1QVR3_9ROSI|nr:unnamed protein product [Dovyalis caffra]